MLHCPDSQYDIGFEQRKKHFRSGTTYSTDPLEPNALRWLEIVKS